VLVGIDAVNVMAAYQSVARAYACTTGLYGKIFILHSLMTITQVITMLWKYTVFTDDNNASNYCALEIYCIH